MNLRYQM